MKKLVVLMLAWVTIGFAQAVVYMPIGATRQLQQVSLIIVAPGVLAEPDQTKGLAAYDACIALNNSSMMCESTRAAAVSQDAQERFIDAFKKLYKGASNPDLVMSVNKLYLVN